MAKRSHHLMTALSKWQLGKLLGRGGLTTGGISWLFALIWSGRPHTIPVSLLCETAKSLSAQAGAGKTSLSWICITTLHVCRKKPQTFQTAKYKKNKPQNKTEDKSQNNKILRYGAARKEKATKQWKHTFWKCSQKDPLPKGFLCTFMPQQTGMRHSKCTKAEGPIGVFNVHHCGFYLASVAPNPTDTQNGAHRNSLREEESSRAGLNTSRGRHRGSFGSGAEMSCEA